MTNICTLFDSNYLNRGLALYQSLRAVSSSFHLYVVAFNDACYQYLVDANLPNLTPISLREFEDEALLAVKPTRSAAEYCWTCTPSVILYCIEKYKLSSCTYVDADMIFYDDPQILIDEMGDRSVLISEHRYTARYDVSDSHGKYCVQFMCFRNNNEGLTALRWWRERCIEWCYARLEDNKFGDQKYLDDWLQRFPGVHVMQHEGGGVAPWNVQQYRVERDNGELYITNKKSGVKTKVVFFHFHGLKFFTDNKVSYCGPLYELDETVKKIIYEPYVAALMTIEDQLHKEGVTFNVNGARSGSPSRMTVYRELAQHSLALVRMGKMSVFSTGLLNWKNHYHYINITISGKNGIPDRP